MVAIKPSEIFTAETLSEKDKEIERLKGELARIRRRLEGVTEIASLAYWEYDIINDVYTFNDQFYRIYHTTAEQVGGYHMSAEEYFHRFVHPEDLQDILEEARKAMESGFPMRDQQLEHRIIHPDGTTGYIAVYQFLVTNSEGQPEKVYGVNQDIAIRKQAEHERQSHLKFFETIDKINQAMQGKDDVETAIRDILEVILSTFECDRAYLMYPCDPEAPSYRVPMQCSKPEYPGIPDRKLEIPMDPGSAGIMRALRHSDKPTTFGPGTPYPLEGVIAKRYNVQSMMAMALYPKSDEPWAFGIHQCADPRTWTQEEKKLFQEIGRRFNNMLASLLAYRDLSENKEFLNSIVENIPNMIFVKDAESLGFRSINRAGEKLIGFSREEVLGKNSYDILPEEEAKKFTELDRKVLDGGEPIDVPEETIRDRAGDPHIMHSKKIPLKDDSGKPRYLLVISEDISDLKKLQTQLNQAQKMEALGTMSGGIAHDFNNILQPILGYCEFLHAELPADSPQRPYVDGILKSGLRAKGLVEQILAFSRQSDSKMMPVKLQLVVKEVVKLCRSVIPSNIEIVQEIQKDCAPIMADPTQLHQIIMNLMVNAYHAMEESGGEINIQLKQDRLDEKDLKGNPLKPGRYARLSISDTGCGMAPSVLEKIFEPYFTTKIQGKGTGLGLAVVYGIVKEHGGHINVNSKVGKGSSFNIYFPLLENSADTLPPTVEKVEMPWATGHEHILLTDDEEAIILLERKILERLGYRVTVCKDGVDALAVFRENPNSFDLVITDVAMPNMTGDQLARELISIRPDIPIIICTGFSEKIGSAEAKVIGVKEFVMKPIAVLELCKKVRKVLDES